MALDKLVDSEQLDASLKYEADRIRAKLGSTDALSFDTVNRKGFGDAVDAIPSGGSAVPEWRLLGEYDIDQLRGENETWAPNINFSDLGGLTDLYFRWENIQNPTTTASSFGNILINGRTVCANNLIPISKNGQASYGYTRAHWNGLTWEFVKSAGAASATNYGPGNVSVLYNEVFNVGACNTLQVAGPSATYRPKTGILKIYGGK